MTATRAGRYVRRIATALIALSLPWGLNGLQAQTPPPGTFVGKWQATFKVSTPRGEEERQADILITPTGGTWQARVQGRQDPCAGRDTPIVMEEMTEDRMSGTLRYSTHGDFCKDVKFAMRRDASGKVTARWGRTELAMERK